MGASWRVPVYAGGTMKGVLLGILAVSIFITGCAKTNTLSTIREDGWTRKTKYTVSKSAGGDQTKPADMFKLPVGANWKVTKSETDTEYVVTATRDLKLDQGITGDLTVVAKDKKPLITNTVKITKLDDGRIEYLETIEWKGKAPKELQDDADFSEFIRKGGFPESVAKDPKIKDFTLAVAKDLWKLLFGPGEPLLGLFMLHTDLAERRLKRGIAQSLSTHLATYFSDQLDEAARRKLVGEVVSEFNSESMMQKEGKEEPSASENNSNGPVAMLIAVKLPGKIVESNGEVDEFSGEVYWGFYPEAAAIGKLELRAVCQP